MERSGVKVKYTPGHLHRVVNGRRALKTSGMKTLLILLFIVLFIYLIFHLCGRSEESAGPVRPAGGLGKTMAVLDGLFSLEDEALQDLKGDILELGNLLDRGPPDTLGRGEAITGKQPGRRDIRSRQEVLQRIHREIGQEAVRRGIGRGCPFSKVRILLIQIALILITVLVIVL